MHKTRRQPGSRVSINYNGRGPAPKTHTLSPDAKVWTCGSCGRFLIEPEHVIKKKHGYTHFDATGHDLCSNWLTFFAEERPDVVAAFLIGGNEATNEIALAEGLPVYRPSVTDSYLPELDMPQPRICNWPRPRNRTT